MVDPPHEEGGEEERWVQGVMAHSQEGTSLSHDEGGHVQVVEEQVQDVSSHHCCIGDVSSPGLHSQCWA